jgi:TolB-like protein
MPPCLNRSAPQRSVAVLPFKNNGADPSQQYFADGITDAITDALAQLPGVKVASRSSAFALRDRNISARAMAESLGVATLVEGSVLRSGSRVRVSARLIDAKSGFAMWSETVTRNEADIFELQDSVSMAIAARLGAASATDRQRSAKRGPVSTEAHDLYLRGRSSLYRRDAPSILAAIDTFKRSIRADARYAPAYAGLSSAYSLYLVLHAWPALSKATSPDSTYGWAARSLAAANRAIELDSGLAEGWAARGYIKLFASTTPDDTEHDLRRALEIRPGYSEAHGWLAQLFAFNGRVPEAMEAATRAVELDPVAIGMRLGYTVSAFASRQYARAFEQAHAVRMTRPDMAFALEYEALALLMLGRSADCLALSGLPSAEAMCLYAGGRGAEAESRVTALAGDWERGGNGAFQLFNIVYYFGYSARVDEFNKWQSLAYERFPLSGDISLGGLNDPVFRQENGNARAHVQGLRQAAWDRVRRESATVVLP